jgi:hypothetical protein
VDVIREFLLTGERLSEDQCYELSLEIEPKDPADRRKSRILDSKSTIPRSRSLLFEIEKPSHGGQVATKDARTTPSDLQDNYKLTIEGKDLLDVVSAASSILKTLVDTSQIDCIGKRELKIGGQRYIALRARSLSSDFFRTILGDKDDDEDTKEMIEEFLFDVGFLFGKQDYKTLSASIPKDTPMATLIAIGLSYCVNVFRLGNILLL